ncbi:MAG TPA: hypothetical protein DCF33_22560 [Saprospirales bacterium]|nr:hypothetical protein [Saprospirales bacterium]
MGLTTCHRKECDCEHYEDCVGNECVQKPNYYRLGDQWIAGHQLYVGALPDGFCNDTIAFDIDTSYTPSVEWLTPFYYFAKVEPWGIFPVNFELIEKYSDTDFLLTSWAHPVFCRPNNQEWYLSLARCKITPDTVFMNIKLRQNFDPTDRFVDSCDVVLLRYY